MGLPASVGDLPAHRPLLRGGLPLKLCHWNMLLLGAKAEHPLLKDITRIERDPQFDLKVVVRPSWLGTADGRCSPEPLPAKLPAMPLAEPVAVGDVGGCHTRRRPHRRHSALQHWLPPANPARCNRLVTPKMTVRAGACAGDSGIARQSWPHCPYRCCKLVHRPPAAAAALLESHVGDAIAPGSSTPPVSARYRAVAELRIPAIRPFPACRRT